VALSAAVPRLQRGWSRGQFALLGIDFLVRTDGTPVLIECTKSAGIRPSLDWLASQNRVLIHETLATMLDARAEWLEGRGKDLEARLAALGHGCRASKAIGEGLHRLCSEDEYAVMLDGA
jgi:hypothetical protein